MSHLETCAKCGAPAVYGSELCYAHGGLKSLKKKENQELSGQKVMGKCPECGNEVTLNETIVDNDTYWSGCHERPLIKAVA